MIVTLSLIFFGIKRYRDHEYGGIINFWRALTMGLAIAVVAEADENTTGPASFIITDPDGNPILVDQPV